jgi:hypothetical protein
MTRWKPFALPGAASTESRASGESYVELASLRSSDTCRDTVSLSLGRFSSITALPLHRNTARPASSTALPQYPAPPHHRNTAPPHHRNTAPPASPHYRSTSSIAPPKIQVGSGSPVDPRLLPPSRRGNPVEHTQYPHVVRSGVKVRSSGQEHSDRTTINITRTNEATRTSAHIIPGGKQNGISFGNDRPR